MIKFYKFIEIMYFRIKIITVLEILNIDIQKNNHFIFFFKFLLI